MSTLGAVTKILHEHTPRGLWRGACASCVGARERTKIVGLSRIGGGELSHLGAVRLEDVRYARLSAGMHGIRGTTDDMLTGDGDRIAWKRPHTYTWRAHGRVLSQGNRAGDST